MHKRIKISDMNKIDNKEIGTCYKRQYETRSEAKKAIKSLIFDSKYRGVKEYLHVYLCPQCNYYHIGH